MSTVLTTTIYAPDKEILWSKVLGRTVQWRVTRESNFYAVWRAKCRDNEPWEESEWDWELRSACPHKNEAIEMCVLGATKDSA